MCLIKKINSSKDITWVKREITDGFGGLAPEISEQIGRNEEKKVFTLTKSPSA